MTRTGTVKNGQERWATGNVRGLDDESSETFAKLSSRCRFKSERSMLL